MVMATAKLNDYDANCLFKFVYLFMNILYARLSPSISYIQMFFRVDKHICCVHHVNIYNSSSSLRLRLLFYNNIWKDLQISQFFSFRFFFRHNLFKNKCATIGNSNHLQQNAQLTQLRQQQ